MSTVKWAYGITTVPERLESRLFHQTKDSLTLAGFPPDDLHVFVDGGLALAKFYPGLSVTVRFPAVRIFGNYFLSLFELYIRSPNADRYVLFQDDLIAVRNLREYLDTLQFPSVGFWNLYTAMDNDTDILRDPNDGPGFVRSLQRCRGALALVFNRAGVLRLLSSPFVLQRPQDRDLGWRNVDGAVVQALLWSEPKWTEYVHFPSLVQHTGQQVPTLSERYQNHGYCYHEPAKTFPGAEFDALQFILKR